MEKPWISTKLTGGLGNRFFQIMAAIGAAERRGYRPVFFLPSMTRSDHGPFDTVLQFFPNILVLESAAEWNLLKENDIEQKVDERKLTGKRPVVLEGYFQNTDNFPSLSSKYLPEIPHSGKQESQEKVAIHFRFGDYRILPHHQMDLGSYYAKCIGQYPKGTTFLLFSDTLEKLPEIADEIREMGYTVEVFSEKDILKTLHAFASCSLGSICSNSTFSWWAAWFAWRRNGPSYSAYFPNKWLQDRMPWNIFTFPFTRFYVLSSLPAFPRLKSFSYF